MTAWSVRRVAGALGLLLIAGCSPPDQPTTTTATPTDVSTVAVPDAGTSAESSLSATPVTQPGMLTGPGVDDTHITLGALVDMNTDRGFAQGFALWQQSANESGGVCGRSIVIRQAGSDDVPTALPDAYRALGTEVLGFVISTASATTGSSLATLLSVDQMPALTVTGTASDLLFSSPVVIGPTDDIIAINAVSALIEAGEVSPGDRIGVVSDGSEAALNAIQGLAWYAEQQDLTLEIQSTEALDSSTLRALPAVFALATPQITAELAIEMPTSTIVVTTINGYDPSLIDDADADHLAIALSTPAVGSDYPGAMAIENALAESGATPGALTFAGYASGITWQRLLSVACESQRMTRDGVLAALTTIGPASAESVLGSSDPALPVQDQLPATRASAMAAADPAAPTGMRPLTALIVADGIEDYAPTLR